MGNLANRMIQYIVALALAARVGPCAMSSVALQEWNIAFPPIEGAFAANEVVTDPRPDLDRLAAQLREGRLNRVDIRTYGQHIDNFLPAARYRDIFVYSGPEVAGAGKDELLCNIRQGDILDGHHPDYVLIPIDFYAELQHLTGLRLVFCGQIEDSPYMSALRHRFPEAVFLPSIGPVGDFERVRRSVHIVPSVSTFGWLAAWLSDAATIFLPVLGLLHPRQSRSTNLLPFGDERFRFYVFPHHYAVHVEQFEYAHSAMRGLWRYMTHTQLAAMLRRPQRSNSLQQNLQFFDEGFYREAYPDIAEAIATGQMLDCRHHYEFYGFFEGREAFYINKSWYCSTYPIAAIELSQGDYVDPHQHWIEAGRARGYRRSPADRPA
jgi:hypothetical protein